MMKPLLVMDVLQGLNLGQQMMVIAVLVIGVFYLFRAKKAGGLLVGLMSTAWLITVSIAAVFVLVIFFDWADPNVGEFTSDMAKAIRMAHEYVIRRLVDFAKGFL